MWTLHLLSISSSCPRRSLARTVSSSFPNQGNQAQGTDGAFSFLASALSFSMWAGHDMGLRILKSALVPQVLLCPVTPIARGPQCQICPTEPSTRSWGLPPPPPSLLRVRSAISSGREGTPLHQPTAQEESLTHGILLIFTVTLKALLCPLRRGEN